MSEWLDWLRATVGKKSGALVSIVASEGSAPRGAGTRMLVTDDALYGTIGGGQLEYRAVEQARAILAHPPGHWRVQDYPLGPLLGQCCGGRVRLLIEHLDPATMDWLADAADERILVSTFMPDRVERYVNDHALPSSLSARGDRPRAGDSLAEIIGQHCRPVYLFGAGHVGQAIARHAVNLPLRLSWFDTRPVFETIEGVAVVPELAIEHCVADAPEDAAILILTHDHGLDYRLTLAALVRSPCAFIGLIGSATKGARFHARLAKDGVDAQTRGRLTSPIGVPGVMGKEPDVIAIAVLAQLLQLRAS
ncbi:xanthine dehydrogenase accessory protein XdhC [Sphingobium sp. CR2-8]|uniref:xanthine dehydrogenase accessory protein XdhC n=1 Tax=Sphingobium sp. CR2-8 TaxID=1306534 RepID=UPI002DBF1610|nr:xanthine dehydrogenase accessory protein XdhC [Sphingobium sp. CR2-8]MEC3909782.1 xanthine dehydrogenase accessory protein XdhC [Sphingobium sp. CR2-8]